MNSVQQTADHSESLAPKVSVIIPAHNTAPFIAETIDSVFHQTFRDFEVIVVNDGSPDTPELEAALQPYMTRIHYLKQENRGVSSARNTGIRHARGEFLAFLDSDDIWLPDYLETQLRFLETHPQVDASIADALLFGGPAGETTLRMLKNGGPGILAFAEMLRREGGQIPSATTARRLRVLEAGMFDERLRIAEDLELFVRICFPDRAVGYLGQVLVKYRQRPGSLTDDPRRRKWNAAEIDALRRLGENLDLSEAQRRLLEKEIAAAAAALALSDGYHHISEHEYVPAVQCLRSANAYYRDPRISVAAFCLNAFPQMAGRLLNWRLKRRPVRRT
jgi:glycosyltransferase involved in cell wall biosynthesis